MTASFGQRPAGDVETLQDFLAGLDEPHLRYAKGYADQLAVGDVAPSAAGLDRALVKEIRRRVWGEWNRRISAMGKRPPRCRP